MALWHWVVDSIIDDNPFRYFSPQLFEENNSGEYSIIDEMINFLCLGLGCSSYIPQNILCMREVVQNLNTLFNCSAERRGFMITFEHILVSLMDLAYHTWVVCHLNTDLTGCLQKFALLTFFRLFSCKES